jgi:succinate-acetate transporter protein
MGLFMGGIGQLIAGLLEFVRKNFLAATGMSIFGTFYLGAGGMYCQWKSWGRNVANPHRHGLC